MSFEANKQDPSLQLRSKSRGPPSPFPLPKMEKGLGTWIELEPIPLTRVIPILTDYVHF